MILVGVAVAAVIKSKTDFADSHENSLISYRNSIWINEPIFKDRNNDVWD